MPRLHYCCLLVAIISINLIRPSFATEPPAKLFLKGIFGARTPELSFICTPSDDLWMLFGVSNTNALAEIDRLQFDNKAQGIFQGTIGTKLFFFEIQNGLINPRFMLEAVYALHRRLALEFVYGLVRDDRRVLARVTTDEAKVQYRGTPIDTAEAGFFRDFISVLPVIRSSASNADTKSMSVTYRLPLGRDGLEIRMIKTENTWRIDSRAGITLSEDILVPFRGARPTQYLPK